MAVLQRTLVLLATYLKLVCKKLDESMSKLMMSSHLWTSKKMRILIGFSTSIIGFSISVFLKFNVIIPCCYFVSRFSPEGREVLVVFVCLFRVVVWLCSRTS